jgi:hypothetical protein
VSTEQESNPYHRAARFSSEQTAGKSYFQLQELIYGPECDISAYRFKIRDAFYVAIVGEHPGEGLDRELQGPLGLGETVFLDGRTLEFLLQRRAQQSSQGPWVEHHHRPGRGLGLGWQAMPKSHPTPVEPLFSLGRLVMTTNLQMRMQEFDPGNWETNIKALIDRHVAGDWGSLEDFDRKQNDRALREGGRLFSAYQTSSGIRLYIITEADRSCTTALLPEDY